MAITTKPMTLQEFLTLPEEKPALEFFDGVVSQKVSPKFQHGLLQGALVERINGFSRPKRVGIAVPELRCIFAGATVVPDVAFIAWERLPRDANHRAANDFFAAPDLAIEIVSPDQSANALYRRCLWYVQHGVRIALQVDPDDVSILRFEAGRAPEVLRGSDRIDLDAVLPGFALISEELFQVLDLS